jgi:hypothetical protein
MFATRAEICSMLFPTIESLKAADDATVALGPAPAM